MPKAINCQVDRNDQETLCPSQRIPVHWGILRKQENSLCHGGVHWLVGQLQMVTSERHMQARLFILTSDAIPGLVVISSIRKQAKRVRRTKKIGINPPWPLHHFLPPFPFLLKYLLWLYLVMNCDVGVNVK